MIQFRKTRFLLGFKLNDQFKAFIEFVLLWLIASGIKCKSNEYVTDDENSSLGLSLVNQGECFLGPVGMLKFMTLLIFIHKAQP